MTPSPYAGTLALLRLDARRDRVLIPVCVLSLALLVVASAQATVALYPRDASAEATLATMTTPTILAIYGPIAVPGHPDSLAIFKMLLMGGVFLALLVIAVVRRHTRAEEESGRTELVGSGVVGRRAQLAAAVALAAATTLVASLLCTAGLVGIGLDAAGSWAFAASWVTIGLSFTGIAAVAAQLTTTARGCGAWAFGALAVAYLLRAAGDVAAGPVSALTWASPLGWAEKVAPFSDDRFAVLALPVGFAALLLGLAAYLLEHRDLGAGVLPTRPGPATAAPALRSPLALAWRLQRGAFLGWAVAFALLGAVVGSFTDSIQDFVQGPEVEEMLRQLGGGGGTLVDTFLAADLAFVALGAAAYGISAALRLHSEEAEQHSELVLSTDTSRWGLLASHTVVALGGSALLLLLAGVSAGVVSGAQTDGVLAGVGHLLPTVLAAVPAVWVCVGLALLLYGAAPAWSYLAWALLAVFVAVGELGGLLKLPATLVGLSPFQHGQVLPGESLTSAAPALAASTLVAAALLAAAGLTFRRRDLR